VPRLCGVFPGICLKLGKKHGENSVRVLNFCRRNSFIFSKLLSDKLIFEHKPESDVEYCSNWLLRMAITMKVSFLARKKQRVSRKEKTKENNKKIGKFSERELRIIKEVILKIPMRMRNAYKGKE
jgi:hypothetical protein